MARVQSAVIALTLLSFIYPRLTGQRSFITEKLTPTFSKLMMPASIARIVSSEVLVLMLLPFAWDELLATACETTRLGADTRRSCAILKCRRLGAISHLLQVRGVQCLTIPGNVHFFLLSLLS